MVKKSVILNLVSTDTSDNISKKNSMWHWKKIGVENMGKSGLYVKKTNGVIKYMSTGLVCGLINQYKLHYFLHLGLTDYATIHG